MAIEISKGTCPKCKSRRAYKEIDGDTVVIINCPDCGYEFDEEYEVQMKYGT